MYIAVIFLSIVSQYVNGYEENICKVPNGDSGRCVNIIRCKPLWDIYTKKRKTDMEHKFIRQSYCGDPSTLIINVCCPSIFIWQHFEPNPVYYHNPLDDLDETPYTLLPFTPSTSSTTEIPQINISEPVTEITIPLQNKNKEVPVPLIETIMLPRINSTQTSESKTETETLVQDNNAEVPVIDAVKPTTVTTVTEPAVPPITNSPIRPQHIPLTRDNNTNGNNNDDNAFTDWLVNNTHSYGCGMDQSRGNKITGGDVAEIDAFPWLVLLEYASGALGCGGSLITARFVLTAAHCIESSKIGRPKKARLAEYNISSFPTDIVEVDGGGFDEITVTIIDVENAWSHPDFTTNFFTNDQSLPVSSHDIGLVKLAQDVEFGDFIQMICLPYSDFIPEFSDNLLLTVAGWGDVKEKTKDYDLKKYVKIPYVPTEKCKITHERLLLDTQICAGGEKDKDSCNGDSGGPLMYSIDNRNYVLGVVSYGHRVCGTEGQPAVYTNVYKYMKWISDVINETE